MTIACATHFTPTSDAAVHVAASLARRMHDHLLLASVVPNTALMLDDGRLESDVAMHLQLEAGRLRLEGIDVSAEVLRGSLDESLARLCHAAHARLLVAGDSRHAQRLFLDAPLDRISAGVPVPLLVVRSERPFDAWARGEGPLRVLLAIDHSWSSTLARDWIVQLSEFGPLDLTAVHIFHPEDEARRRGMGVADDDVREKLAKILYDETEAALVLLPDNVKRRVKLEIGRHHIAGLLIDVASTEQADLLVLGTHRQHGLLGQMTSISHQVLADALMSVAFIPEESGRTPLRSVSIRSADESAGAIVQ
ncbi:MAG: universal stress protein [Archangium sp.]|nr:universal stress protein [Archangium sp.]